jgi:hypothetical protein
VAPLTVGEALHELLARLGALPGRALAFGADELHQWPPDAVAVFKAHAVLRPGAPGETAVCPGCEQACVMPVQQRMRPGRPAAAFIVCDRRDDIGRVPLAPALMERWRVDGQTLGDALATLLGSGPCQAMSADPGRLRLGTVSGRTDKTAVHLGFDDHGRAVLELAGHVVDLAAVLTIQAGRLVLDTGHLRRCADTPASGAKLDAETPEQRTERLQARKAALQKQHVRAFLQVIAQEEGLSKSMVKKILDRPGQASKAPLPAWAAALASRRGVSPAKKRQS